MLRIRTSQLEAFAAVGKERFRQQLLEHLAECWPRLGSLPGQLQAEEVVAKAQADADKYSLTTERDVCRYLDLLVALDPDFDVQPWAQRILTAEAPADCRVDRLCKHAIRQRSRP